MSKLTVSAAGGALPAEGHDKTRRAALALFAAAPALVLPAAAIARPVGFIADGLPDPAYAAIAAHERAEAAFDVLRARFEDFGSEGMTDEQTAEYRAASLAENAALEAVARTFPTTRRGAIEALRHVGAYPGGAPVAMFANTLISAMFPADGGSHG